MDSLSPRKVPEPTRFPSGFFEPCVPDASLVFGNGIFDVPKQVPKEEKLSHRPKHTDGRGETSTLPLWAKAYSLRKKQAGNMDKENVCPPSQEKSYGKIGNRVLNSLDINCDALPTTEKLVDIPKYGYGLQSSKMDNPRICPTVPDPTVGSKKFAVTSLTSEQEEKVNCVIEGDVASAPVRSVVDETKASEQQVEFVAPAREDNMVSVLERRGEMLKGAPVKENLHTKEFSMETMSGETSLRSLREKSNFCQKITKKEMKPPIPNAETEKLNWKPPLSCDISQSTLTDPLIRALFHLQNQHTELLQQLMAEVKGIGLKQKKMFAVFQKLCSASNSSNCQTATEKASVGSDKHPGSNDTKQVDKCTQTVSTQDKMVQSSVDASTETGREGDIKEGSDQVEESKEYSEKMGAKYDREAQGLARTTHKINRSDTSKARLGEDRPVVTEDRKRRPEPAAPEITLDVRGLVKTMQNIASRSENREIKVKSTSKDKDVLFSKNDTVYTPSEEVETPRRGSQQDVNGLIKTMRTLASRYKNSDFIKVPDLEDVAEATENSSDSEDSSSSDAINESLTIGDLSLVPQNVSLTPNHSVHIDSRGLEISCNSIASESSDDSETEGSSQQTEVNVASSEKADKSTIYLYKNIMSKVQKILDHNKTASDIRRNSLERKTCAREEGFTKTKTRSH